MALKAQAEVLVVGAGPVGMFAALSLAERGVDVQIIDKEWRGSTHSYALALHPHSLQMLAEHAAVDTLVEQAHRVERMAFYDGEERVGELDFTRISETHPYLLVAPQSALERTLEDRLKQNKVKVIWNHQAMRIVQDGQGVSARVARMEKYSTGYPIAHTEWMVAKEYDARAKFVVGADGYHSFVRKALGVTFVRHDDAEAFAVYEFPCSMPFTDEVRVLFRDGKTNVVWPLDAERGRWSFQVDPQSPAPPTIEALREFLAARAPWFGADVEEINWATTAMFERRLVDRFGGERIWLAGDAAHITGPVGAHSMNVGLREARDLAERIAAVLKGGASLDLLAAYETERQAEWRKLLGLEGGPRATENTPAWSKSFANRILPCVPASGDELQQSLAQVGLRLV